MLKASEESPNSYVFLTQLATAQRRIGYFAESRQSIRKAWSLVENQLVENPRDGGARAFLAYYCASLDQKARAESEIRQALRLDSQELNVLWMAVQTYESTWEKKRNSGSFAQRAARNVG